MPDASVEGQASGQTVRVWPSFVNVERWHRPTSWRLAAVTGWVVESRAGLGVLQPPGRASVRELVGSKPTASTVPLVEGSYTVPFTLSSLSNEKANTET